MLGRVRNFAQIALGKIQNTTDFLKLNYTYGTTDNNRNVLN